MTDRIDCPKCQRSGVMVPTKVIRVSSPRSTKSKVAWTIVNLVIAVVEFFFALSIWSTNDGMTASQVIGISMIGAFIVFCILEYLVLSKKNTRIAGHRYSCTHCGHEVESGGSDLRTQFLP